MTLTASEKTHHRALSFASFASRGRRHGGENNRGGEDYSRAETKQKRGSFHRGARFHVLAELCVSEFVDIFHVSFLLFVRAVFAG